MKLRLATLSLIAISLTLPAAPALAGDLSDSGQAQARVERDDGPQRRLVIGGDCTSCDFRHANLAGAHLHRGDFSGADFSSAQLLGARFINMRLDQAVFRDASLREVQLSNVTMTGADLRDAGLANMRAHQAMLNGARLDNARMSGANLVQVSLNGASLRDAVMTGATVRSADLREAILSNARLENVVVQHAVMQGAILRDANLSGAFLDHVDLSNADLRNAVLAGIRLRAVNLSGADLSNVSGLDSAALAGACGDAATRLPASDSMTLADCTEAFASATPLDDRTLLAEAEARRLAQLEAAQAAFESALSTIQSQARASGGLEGEALERARNSLREAARAQAELARNHRAWRFDMRRSEIGEPMQSLMESTPAPATRRGPLERPEPRERPDRP